MSKKAIIFGDSYSTFENYVPNGYSIYYSGKGRPETDVTNVSETWWYQVIEAENMELVMNNSWSGSTIGYRGYDNCDCSQSSSFIFRLRSLVAQGFFAENRIDTVFVFGGTNDSWANAPLGTAQYDHWEEKDLYFVLPAICCFLHDLKETLPGADIYCLINTDMKPEISKGLQEACCRYGISSISFESIHKNDGHPTIQGMKDIKNTVLKFIRGT